MKDEVEDEYKHKPRSGGITNTATLSRLFCGQVRLCYPQRAYCPCLSHFGGSLCPGEEEKTLFGGTCDKDQTAAMRRDRSLRCLIWATLAPLSNPLLSLGGSQTQAVVGRRYRSYHVQAAAFFLGRG